MYLYGIYAPCAIIDDKGETFYFASVGPNQGLTKLSLMWTGFDTQNFKRPTNCFSFDIATAFCKLVPETNRHVRNDVKGPAEKRYNNCSYWFIQMA